MKECQLCKNCFSDDVAACPNDGMPTAHTIPGEPVLEGKYQIECRLGQGGMGVVYKARHAYLKTQLAIKVILPDLVGNDPQLVTRFRQEALAAAAIRHQNVVSVTDYGVIDGTLPFLVMEYVDGESLHDLLAREKSLQPDRALEMISAVCAGVGAAHHQGIVHRDLKPLNVMICSDRPNLSQAVKILDFGLAKIKSGELLGSFIQAQTTGLMGSPYYMAPEQWADEEPDARSDVYSLGVMFFQMVAGDVPFKGSSIPAIMKKHISDAAPTLADVGIHVSPEIERAIAHSLQKDKTKRTPTVEAFVDELTAAIRPGSISIHTPTGRSLPVSSLKVVTRPPRASVFVDNVAVGQTLDTGELLLEGVQSGNHHLRISHNGFRDWLGDVVCDGKPQHVVAELQPGDSRAAVPMPTEILPAGSIKTNFGISPEKTMSADAMDKTVVSGYDQHVVPKKKGGISAIIIGIVGLLALFVIGGIAIGAAYMTGLIGGKPPIANGNQPPASPASSPGTTGTTSPKPEMVQIPGGTFIMGRNKEPYEFGEHSVTVGNFAIGKTEITNAQYLDFVKETNHAAPKHWPSGLPVRNTENRPVTYVSLDDAIAYAKWRSVVDGVTYRLPTEEEWEYVARNGSKENLFPWGDQWSDGKAIVGKRDSEPEDVGSKPEGANSWGVLDLIGNVWEWTSTEYKPYPGSEGKVDQTKDITGNIMIRGGSANENPAKLKITSTFRNPIPRDTTDKTLGFRLVRVLN
jgi:formylglycine-generating enzyme required for sulfatase activity/serine/threonine protein kinase